jgi:hypothetical protein
VFGRILRLLLERVSWSSDGRFILAAVAEGDADVMLLNGLIVRP